MNRRWKRTAAALLTALALTTPALGVNIIADGTALPADQAWVENGASYMTLRSFAALTGRALRWTDGQARALSLVASLLGSQLVKERLRERLALAERELSQLRSAAPRR